MNARTFTSSPAVRGKMPLWIGLIGPSDSGKTFSALRLAKGIKSVDGGEIFMIDTESGRALHYADDFDFQHVPFGAPFASLDYLAAVDHCIKQGAGTIIIDSMSHEHEGPGGHLQAHDAECERLKEEWNTTSRNKVQFAAWAKPKAERAELINTLLQKNVNLILCFRAKQKLKIIPGKKEPVQLGWQPIGGEEFPYECTVRFLLRPGARGTPSWKTEHEAERECFKLPRQFQEMFKESAQLSEAHGAAMAEWAAGKPKASDKNLEQAIAVIEMAPNVKTLRSTVVDLKKNHAWSDEQSKRMKSAIDKRQKELLDSVEPSREEAS